MFRAVTCLLSFVAMFAAGHAEACSAPPQHMYLAHDDAIADADWIVVAETEGRSEIEGRPAYTMRVIEYVKGSGPDKINVRRNESGGLSLSHSKKPTEGNFYGHTASSFWTSGGLYSNWPDCRIHPSFLFAGHRYLIFGPLDYNVGFENIVEGNDTWLDYVRARVGGKEPPKPYPLDVKSYLKRAEAVLRVKVHWDGTSSQWTEEILKGPAANYLNMAYVTPQASFDSRLNPACKGLLEWGPRPTELDVLFVFERIPAKEIRRGDSLECLGGDLKAHGSSDAYGLFSLTGLQTFEIEDDRVIFPAEQIGFQGRQIMPTNENKVSMAELVAMLK